MSENSELEALLTNVLAKAAENLGLSSYKVNLDLAPLLGDGLMGEFYKVSLTNTATDAEIHLAVKKAPVNPAERERKRIRDAYLNEIYFYSTILPTLLQFQKEEGGAGSLLFSGAVPRYLASCSEELEEIIVFEDITKNGFVLRERDLLLDEEHAELVFRTYGQFHALSFAYKAKRPEEYARLVAPVVQRNLFVNISRSFGPFIERAFPVLLAHLHPTENAQLIRKIQEKYLGKVAEVMAENAVHRGPRSGILHGDCWSNNMMFKYQDNETLSKLQEMNLLDFQIIFMGSPVHDLAYFFYTGGTKELFDKWDYFLDVYCESFLKSVRELGVNEAEKLLTKDDLVEDWKNYAICGVFMALLLTKIKLINKEDLVKVNSNQNSGKDEKEGVSANFNEAKFVERIMNIVLHADKVGAF